MRSAAHLLRQNFDIIRQVQCLDTSGSEVFGVARLCSADRLCGLVVRVSGYRYRGPGFDSRRYQIF